MDLWQADHTSVQCEQDTRLLLFSDCLQCAIICVLYSHYFAMCCSLRTTFSLFCNVLLSPFYLLTVVKCAVI